MHHISHSLHYSAIFGEQMKIKYTYFITVSPVVQMSYIYHSYPIHFPSHYVQCTRVYKPKPHVISHNSKSMLEHFYHSVCFQRILPY
jgi:hypothetical protein